MNFPHTGLSRRVQPTTRSTNRAHGPFRPPCILTAHGLNPSCPASKQDNQYIRQGQFCPWGHMTIFRGIVVVTTWGSRVARETQHTESHWRLCLWAVTDHLSPSNLTISSPGRQNPKRDPRLPGAFRPRIWFQLCRCQEIFLKMAGLTALRSPQG